MAAATAVAAIAELVMAVVIILAVVVAVASAFVVTTPAFIMMTIMMTMTRARIITAGTACIVVNLEVMLLIVRIPIETQNKFSLRFLPIAVHVPIIRLG